VLIFGGVSSRVCPAFLPLNSRASGNPEWLVASLRAFSDMLAPILAVMAGPVPAIHDFQSASKTWLAGTSPAMTLKGSVQRNRKVLSSVALGPRLRALAR